MRSVALLACLLVVTPLLAKEKAVADILASLCDPMKLATLSERGANPRVRKIVYWLEMADRSGLDPEVLAWATMQRVGWGDDRGRLTAAAMLRNLDIARKLGCTDEAGMEDMRRGQAPTIRSGPYAGDELSVDHIIPRAVYPEYDCVLANLELMPLRMNIKKSASMGQRQGDVLAKFRAAGF